MSRDRGGSLIVSSMLVLMWARDAVRSKCAEIHASHRQGERYSRALSLAWRPTARPRSTCVSAPMRHPSPSTVFAQAAAIDRSVGADLHAVLNDDAAQPRGLVARLALAQARAGGG